tara:strand:- start:4375 stop:4809 length:435 start_codon:yes stop_codon:yes gene_type:complete
MPNHTILKASSPNESELTNVLLVTKEYDGGDSSLVKSYSRVNVSYAINGSGISPLTIKYKTAGGNFKNLISVPSSYYSTQVGLEAKFKRTNGIFQTAEFDFPSQTRGKSLTLKLILSSIGSEGSTFTKFKLSDITFTFRLIKRK